MNIVLGDEFEELADKYCETDEISDDIISNVEQCYQLDTLDFSLLNPFTECKQKLFTNNESAATIRLELCNNEHLDDQVSVLATA